MVIVAGNGLPPDDGGLAETVPLSSALIARLHDPVSQELPPALSGSFSSLQQLGELLEGRRWDFVQRQVIVSQVFQNGVDYLFILFKRVFFNLIDSYLIIHLALFQIIRHHLVVVIHLCLNFLVTVNGFRLYHMPQIFGGRFLLFLNIVK